MKRLLSSFLLLAAILPAGAAERILHTGDAFFEPAGHKLLRFDNASSTAPAAITVFYLTDTATRPLIQMLDVR